MPTVAEVSEAWTQTAVRGLRTAVAGDRPHPDMVEACAAAAAIGAALFAGRCVQAALGGDPSGAAAAAIGFAGLSVLEALFVHCGAWLDATTDRAGGAPVLRRRWATCLACLAVAALLQPMIALAAAAVVGVLAAAMAYARIEAERGDSAAAQAEGDAWRDLAPALDAPAAVKAAGLEMATARRFERRIAEALPAQRRGLAMWAFAADAPARACEFAAILCGGLAFGAVRAGALPIADAVALTLLCLRAPTALQARARYPASAHCGGAP